MPQEVRLGLVTRRGFLETGLRAGAGSSAARLLAATGGPRLRRPAGARPIFPDPACGWRGDSSLAASLRGRTFPPDSTLPLPTGDLATPSGPPSLPYRLPDLRRHFVFEYYPWYANDPYRHWEQWSRSPPHDIAATCVPRLGPYDSRSRRTLEAHARWIAESGVGAVNLSWWGPGSFEDRATNTVMDVMRDHDIKVTFHLEPYSDHRAQWLATDVLHLIREFGDRRGWDCFLLLSDATGAEGPVFKSFRTILPSHYVDCHGARHAIPDYAPDDRWRRQTDMLRHTLARDFHHVTLLADSLDVRRTRTAGFDGIAVYDSFVPPEAYGAHASAATRAELLFSFNVNPGFDGIEPRMLEPGTCHEPRPFAPDRKDVDFRTEPGRERAAELASMRIRRSLEATLRVQTDPRLHDSRRGFFLVYLNSFNEWHEGTAFEPMKDAFELCPEERELGYHNPEDGGYRLRVLGPLLQAAVAGRAAAANDDEGAETRLAGLTPSSPIGYGSSLDERLERPLSR